MHARAIARLSRNSACCSPGPPKAKHTWPSSEVPRGLLSLQHQLKVPNLGRNSELQSLTPWVIHLVQSTGCHSWALVGHARQIAIPVIPPRQDRCGTAGADVPIQKREVDTAGSPGPDTALKPSWDPWLGSSSGRPRWLPGSLSGSCFHLESAFSLRGARL